jgi:GLPGLI family protein
MKKIFCFLFFIVSIHKANAQSTFYNTVKIEFEKTLSIRQLYKELEPTWYERIKDRLPASVLSYYDFIADTTASIFKPGREVPIDPRSISSPLADKSVVYTNFKTNSSISQKPVFEETFLVEDSLLKIKWKLSPDTRIIAGFECRKAIGILSDSITLFAFYTDELMITGGPEGIHGLPGMILGLGIPRLHTTWFATKVEVTNINTGLIAPATKGKKVDRATMIKSLDRFLKQMGPYGSKMIVNFVI